MIEVTAGLGNAAPDDAAAAQYLRMSTDHQRYSIDNQAVAIRDYAAAHHLRIVRTYEDRGRSGLTFHGRQGLRALLQDVLAGDHGFSVLVVYDVSRWGRFQDADEAAYYEFLCRRAGIQVAYCAEPFENDGSPMATVFKSLKRAMAGEYSRELSKKVTLGCYRKAEKGYRQGGAPGYGLRRLLVDYEGRPRGILEQGDRKTVLAGSVVLVPGPKEEVRLVRRIFRMFVSGRDCAEIARRLNAEGRPNARGGRWNPAIVRRLLTSEKYIGNNVWNRTSFKLKQIRRKNPPSEWARADGVFEPIVNPAIFRRAQEIMQRHPRLMTDEELIAGLRRLYLEKGALSVPIIDRCSDIPGAYLYRRRFRGLLRAYALAGFRPDGDYRYLTEPGSLTQVRSELVAAVAEHLRRLGTEVVSEQHHMLAVGRHHLRIVAARYKRDGRCEWQVNFNYGRHADWTLVVRMEADHRTKLDYLLIRKGACEGIVGLRRTLTGELASCRAGTFQELLPRMF